MPLKKVFIASSLSEAVYLARREFPDSIVVDSPSSETFVRMVRPSLVSSNKTLIFVGSDSLPHELIEASVDLPKVEIVLVFKQLRSNSKLYKFLKKKSEVHKCEKLTNYKAKRSFIEGLFKDLGIPKSYVYNFAQLSGESRARIEQEAKKLKVALKVLDNPLSCISSDVAYYDLFNLLDAIVERDLLECLKIVSKMETELDTYQLAHLLNSYVNFFIFLSLGDDKTALTFWKMPPYLLGDKKALAKRLGFGKLSNLSKLIQIHLLDYTNGKLSDNRIRQFIFESIHN